MVKKTAVPDAWDDDWEEAADKADALPIAPIPKPVESEVKATKAQRLAEHAETNKKLWQSAEEPETFHFLATRDNIPLKSEFKPTLKVLSRKPAPKIVKHVDPVTGLEKLTLDEGEEEVEVKPAQLSPEELRAKAQKDREERRKNYDLVRQRIFMGSPSDSGGSTPGAVTPPNGEEGRSTRGKGRGRGGGGGGGDRNGGVKLDNRRPESQSGNKELFDPNYTPKPERNMQKRAGESSHSGRSTPREEDQIIRTPKGPDGSGRGGFGFARRGGKPT